MARKSLRSNYVDYESTLSLWHSVFVKVWVSVGLSVSLLFDPKQVQGVQIWVGYGVADSLHLITSTFKNHSLNWIQRCAVYFEKWLKQLMRHMMYFLHKWFLWVGQQDTTSSHLWPIIRQRSAITVLCCDRTHLTHEITVKSGICFVFENCHTFSQTEWVNDWSKSNFIQLHLYPLWQCLRYIVPPSQPTRLAFSGALECASHGTQAKVGARLSLD